MLFPHFSMIIFTIIFREVNYLDTKLRCPSVAIFDLFKILTNKFDHKTLEHLRKHINLIFVPISAVGRLINALKIGIISTNLGLKLFCDYTNLDKIFLIKRTVILPSGQTPSALQQQRILTARFGTGLST